MTKELSPSEYEGMVSTGKAKPTAKTSFIKYGVVAIGVLVLCGVRVRSMITDAIKAPRATSVKKGLEVYTISRQIDLSD